MRYFDDAGATFQGEGANFVTTGLRAALVGGAAIIAVLSASASALAFEYPGRSYHSYYPSRVPGYTYQRPGYVYPQPAYQAPALQTPIATLNRVKQSKQTKQDKKKESAHKALQVPLIAISIADQRLTLYDNGVPIAHAPVSTGMAGHPTPTGIFSVIQKERFHRSNIYSNAPMPFMQRITWSGVALHAGVLPGYPASHGCIRMPNDFAVRLYGLTRMGARVIIARNAISPLEFEHRRLFVLNKPEPTKLGQASQPQMALKIATVHPALEGLTKTAAGDSSVVSDAAPVKDANAAADAATAAPAGNAAANVVVTAEPAKAVEPDAVKAPQKSTGAVLVTPVPVVAPQPIEMPNRFEPAVSEPPKAFVPPASQPPSAAPIPAAAPALEPYGPPRPLRPGPITVFVSKKEGKVFVRKAFQPLFDAPVTIARPELPLGTHLFTAVEAKSDGTNFRWLAVSMPAETLRRSEPQRAHQKGAHPARMASPTPMAPPASTAAQALERIEMPPEALTQISALMSTGASLIITDQGLGPETGLETDFIVLAH